MRCLMRVQQRVAACSSLQQLAAACSSLQLAARGFGRPLVPWVGSMRGVELGRRERALQLPRLAIAHRAHAAPPLRSPWLIQSLSFLFSLASSLQVLAGSALIRLVQRRV